MNQQIFEVVEIMSQLYGPLCAETKEVFASKLRIVTFDKETILLKEGQDMDKVYFVLKGGAREYYLLDNGKDISSWFSFEHDFITNTISLFTGVPSKYYLKTLEDSIFLEIPRLHLMEMSLKFHDFESVKSKIIIKIMLELQERNYSLLRFRTAKEKYNNFLQLHHHAERIPLSYIASFLGITLETLSRIRNPKYSKK